MDRRLVLLLSLLLAGCTPVANSAGTTATASSSAARASRLLWASASGPFYVGANKVLWERPRSVVSIGGKLLDGDAKAAGVPSSVLDFVVYVYPR